MFYVSSHWRVARWFLFLCLNCALAVSLNADVQWNGSAWGAYFNYDGCTAAQITLKVYWSGYYAGIGGNGAYQTYNVFNPGANNATVTMTMNPGENYLGLTLLNSANANGGGTIPLQHWNYSCQVVSVTGNTNAKTGYMPLQQASPLDGGTNILQVGNTPLLSSYSPSGTPCGGGSPGVSDGGAVTTDMMASGAPGTNSEGAPTLGTTYQNNSGVPVLLPDGTYLQPGQSIFEPGAPTPEGGNGGGSDIVYGVGPGGQLSPYQQYNDTSSNQSVITFPPYTNAVNAGLLTSNGPIVWSPPMSTNSALATEAGDSAILNGLNQNALSMNNDSTQFVNAMTIGISNLMASMHNSNNPISVQFTGTNQQSGSSSNVWIQNWPSNSVASPSNNFSTNVNVMNFPENELSNTVTQASNSFNAWAGYTNQVYGIMSPLNPTIAALQSAFPNGLSDDAGSAQEQDIVIGNPAMATITVRAGALPSSMTVWYGHLRSLIAWLIVVLLVMSEMKQMMSGLKEVLKIDPVNRISLVEAVGSLGGGVVAAIVFSVTIVLAMSVMIVVGEGIIVGEMSFWSGSGESPTTFFSNMGWAFQWASQFIPITVFVTALATRIFFWVVIEVLVGILGAAMKIVVGTN